MQGEMAKARRRGLNRLAPLRALLMAAARLYYTRIWGMDIDPSAKFSLSAQFDRTFPIGVHVGPNSYVAFEARVLTHDRTRGLYLHTRIGANCFIGGRALLLPGVEIGAGSVVGAGAVVTRSVPPGSLVAGNPARVLRAGIDVGAYGRFAGADATEAALATAGLT
ncbi:acyltransferase [Limimaricola pyoseonensis]|uniref:Hexapeptide repeat of succinyl-transferase n=1 Tax=Limimaricola pyoseonensis TaxID=521013 RepID=A0A1G7IWW4_9RHOB|nr:acyltransferase [Limimaricola pyoseonensis]SDF16779.1 Hexapeptide repeat of succinyl-transferase [Limimaricola pyoseonensis]